MPAVTVVCTARSRTRAVRPAVTGITTVMGGRTATAGNSLSGLAGQDNA